MFRKIMITLTLFIFLAGSATADGGYGATLITGNSFFPEEIQNEVKPTACTVQNREENFYKALDGQADTVYSYTAWGSLATDDIPEVELTFDRVTLTDIWIRNGYQTDYARYYGNARIKRLRVVICADNGKTQYEYLLTDIYDMETVADDWMNGYQRIAFPVAAENVTKVELWIRSWYTGNHSTYNVSISDIAFSGEENGHSTSPAAYGPVNHGISVRLNQRLATRSGPGTQYNGLGSYFSAGTMLRALSAGYDTRNGIWWIQVEFDYGGEKRRAYTGVKRLEMNTSDVRTEQVLWTGAVLETSEYGFYGPGPEYTKYPSMIPAGTTGTVYSVEGEFAQLEYLDSGENVWKRVWVPLASLSLG